MMAAASQPEDKYVLRLPNGMRDQLKVSARANHRSMNAEIICRLKAKGPAEAATSPDHGSTKPQEGTAMNKPNDTTVPAMPATPDYAESFNSLYEPIEKAMMFGTVLRFLAEMSDEGGTPGFNEDVRCCMAIMGHEVHSALDALRGRFREFEEKHTSIENARVAARRRGAL